MASTRGKPMDHIENELLLAYVTEMLGYEEMLAADTHLAECPDCARRVRSFRSVRARLDDLWSSWTPKQHAEEFLRRRAATALGSVRSGSRLEKRLQAWMVDLGAQVETALRIAFEAPARGAALIQSELDWLGDPVRVRSFSPVPATVAVHGDDHRPRWVTVESAGSPWVRVTADPGAGMIRVRLQLHPEPWPLALLIPAGEGAASVREFRRVEGEGFLLAEFDDVGEDECLLVLQRTYST